MSWLDGRSQEPCTVDGCHKTRIARGYCDNHYRRFRRYGDPTAGKPSPKPQEPTCAVEGCDRDSKAQGLCEMHYKRWRNHGDPNVTRVLTIREGDRFGVLVAARDRVGSEEHLDCICDCGQTTTIRVSSLGRNGYVNSCGCRKSGPTNPNWRGGVTEHPLYDVYFAMLGRCHASTNPRYADYGGRGITVCDRWREDFWAFVADMGERPGDVSEAGRAEFSLDRIDNDRGYEPGNVRWANAIQQRHNQRRVIEAAS